MRNPCLDEGILQGYFDGQLAPEMARRVVSHLASCEVCTESAREVEREMELTTAAFASEMSLSVPSERLRSRLDEAITGLNTGSLAHPERDTSRFRTWFASFGSAFNLSPQRAVGFASLVIVVVLAAVVGGIVMRQRETRTGAGIFTWNQSEPGDIAFRGPLEPEEKPAEVSIKNQKRRPITVPGKNDKVVELAHRLLPGEKNYLQAISVLTDAIEANGETSLKPTLLADYKRNLAVVDQAITATQRTARTNRESTDAAEMLYAVYQSKLDLLSAVAEQSRPMIAQR